VDAVRNWQNRIYICICMYVYVYVYIYIYKGTAAQLSACREKVVKQYIYIYPLRCPCSRARSNAPYKKRKHGSTLVDAVRKWSNNIYIYTLSDVLCSRARSAAPLQEKKTRFNFSGCREKLKKKKKKIKKKKKKKKK